MGVTVPNAWCVVQKSNGDYPSCIPVRDDKTFAICAEPADLDEFMRILECAAIEDAMANDGGGRGTVEIYAMDREFQL